VATHDTQRRRGKVRPAAAAPPRKVPARGTAAAGPRPAFRRAPLGSLRVFVAVAEHKSFTRGADALGVTASAASMQIQALEDYLRVPLFRRNGRQVELTAAGAMLRPKVEQALADLERAIDEARADRGSGPLRITTLASFLAQWLLPRLPDFTARQARIDVQVHTSTELVDFVKTGIDAGIRFGSGSWPRLHCEKVIDEWLVPVCTPALLTRNGAIGGAHDLTRYKLLHSTSQPWTAWLLESGPDEVWPSSGAAFDDVVAVVRAAEAGQGLALSRWSLVADVVALGRLAVAGRAVRSAHAYYFVCPPANRMLEKVALFREWLTSEGARFPSPPPAPTARSARS
jgi:LysR family transcriptional regulator, glycine cleavage system transcriptional activator